MEDKKIADDIAEAFHEGWRGGYDAGYQAGKRDAVKHGEWEDNGANYRCSVCGNEEPYYSDAFCNACGRRCREDKTRFKIQVGGCA